METGTPCATRGSAPLLLLGATTIGVVATWAAAAGPDKVFRNPGRNGQQQATTPRHHALPQVNPVRPDGVPQAGTDWIQLTLAIVVGLLLAAVVATLLTVLYQAVRRASLPRLSRRDAAPAELVSDPVAAVAASIRADAEEQVALLEAGSPRNGIVACWHRFETQAEAAGVARRPAETTSEFTLRVLDLVEADASAVARLAGLYREARFSEHEIDEDAREAAREALARIHTQLGGLLSTVVR